MVHHGDTKLSISNAVSSRDLRDETVDSDTSEGWLLHDQTPCESDWPGNCSSLARTVSSFKTFAILVVRGLKKLSLDMLDVLVVM